jgi:hypothetical protein
MWPIVRIDTILPEFFIEFFFRCIIEEQSFGRGKPWREVGKPSFTDCIAVYFANREMIYCIFHICAFTIVIPIMVFNAAEN